MIKIKSSEVAGIKKGLVIKQGGVCPICGYDLTKTDPKNIVLDHDHATGVVRAALHRGCNRCEGVIFKAATTYGKARGVDGIASLMQRLIDFWKLHSEPQTNFIYYTHTDKPLKIPKQRKRKCVKS